MPLSVTAREEDSRSFEFSPASQLTFRQVDRAVFSPSTTLASLVTDNPAAVGGLHARLAGDGPWNSCPETHVRQRCGGHCRFGRRCDWSTGAHLGSDRRRPAPEAV